MNIKQRSSLYTFGTLLLLIGIVSLFGHEVRMVFRAPLIIFSGVVMFFAYRAFFKHYERYKSTKFKSVAVNSHHSKLGL